jgi:hypothetical protein
MSVDAKPNSVIRHFNFSLIFSFKTASCRHSALGGPDMVRVFKFPTARRPPRQARRHCHGLVTQRLPVISIDRTGPPDAGLNGPGMTRIEHDNDATYSDASVEVPVSGYSGRGPGGPGAGGGHRRSRAR